ncbi:hypothetical protein Dimus_026129 [Dionaea muscipula]
MHSLCPLLRPPPLSAAHRVLVSRRHPLSSNIRMSSTQTELIEHIVLFKVNPTDPAKVKAMVDRLNGLKSLGMVLHLTAGPINRLRSPEPLHFTHLLHCRYRTKDDLNSYAGHPDHLAVIRANLPICEDTMAVDWVSQCLDGDPISPLPGTAMRAQFVKLKEGLGEKETEEVVGVIGGLKGKLGEVDSISVGVNFSPARARGFSIGSIGFFPGMRELEAAAEKQEVAAEKDRVREYIDGVMVVDYIVPSAQSASL